MAYNFMRIVHANSDRKEPVPQIARDQWKDCAFNNTIIPCKDTPFANGEKLIVWKDGLRMRYRRQPEIRSGDPSYLIDELGGVWRLEVLQQGNTIMTNLSNNNKILVPLRLTCKPPLVGEVGYCHKQNYTY